MILFCDEASAHLEHAVNSHYETEKVPKKASN